MEIVNIFYITVIPLSLGITVFFIKRYISSVDTKLENLDKITRSNQLKLTSIDQRVGFQADSLTSILYSIKKITHEREIKVINEEVITKLLENSVSNNNSLNNILKILGKHNNEIKDVKDSLSYSKKLKKV